MTRSLHRLFSQKVVWLFTAALLALAVFVAFRPITQSQTDFYNNLWAPVHLLVRGESPYNTTPLHPDLPALWMPPAIGFFSFLGFFRFEMAQQIWFLLNILGLAGLLYLSISKTQLTPVLLPGLLLAYFFPPAVNHFALGQVSILIALSLLLAVRFVDSSPWRSAFFLAFGMTKPQLGFLVLFGICVYLIKQAGWMRLLRYGLRTFLAVLTLSLPLFLADSKWISDFFASLQANVQWTHPSLFSQLGEHLGEWKYLPWGVLLLCALWAAAQLWMRLSKNASVLWTLALTLPITPYVWSWDFVLLLPLFFFALSNTNWKGKAILIAGYALAGAGMTVIQLSENFHNSRFWWVPLWFVLLYAWSARFPPLPPSAQYKSPQVKD
ncbi:MAG: DUF2029 domain-containing protein [Chloroflexi bacterium]|nr:DUF2029 domain-containing protein [Chloroflexota bacterium]